MSYLKFKVGKIDLFEILFPRATGELTLQKKNDGVNYRVNMWTIGLKICCGFNGIYAPSPQDVFLQSSQSASTHLALLPLGTQTFGKIK